MASGPFFVPDSVVFILKLVPSGLGCSATLFCIKLPKGSISTKVLYARDATPKVKRKRVVLNRWVSVRHWR